MYTAESRQMEEIQDNIQGDSLEENPEFIITNQQNNLPINTKLCKCLPW
jgi:hypothetical protein